MKLKIYVYSAFFIFFLLLQNSVYSQQKKYQYPFQDPSLSFEERAENLVSLLTVDEKIHQMVNNAPAIPRLGIPAYNWWNESLHGVARSPYHVTSYPQAIGMAATWDTASMRIMADYCAVEGRAIFNDSRKKGKTGIYLGLTYWTPNINIFRDPRWGRGQETYGEDPFLTSEMGKSFVYGLQGNDPKYLKASACAKHFAVHSGPEWNRSTFDARVSDYDLWDTYLPAFRALIVDAKVSGVMCAYNRFEGQPCCGNDLLMMDILRNQWGFTGYVTSDCSGINHFWRTHKTHPDEPSAAAAAVLHGTDCECAGKPTYFALDKSLSQGLLTEKDIDASLKRLFIIRMRLGMFDPDELVPFARIDSSVLENDAHQAHALKMARQSIVLLKNENNLLPLEKSKKIAVVGPNAHDEDVLLANYYGYPSEITTVLEGINKKLNKNVLYEKGVNLTDNSVFKADYKGRLFKYNGKEGFQAEYFQNTKLEGEPVLVRIEKVIDHNWGDGEQVSKNLIARNMGVRWKSTFVPDRTGEYVFEIKGDDRCRFYVNGEKMIEADRKGNYFTLKAENGKSYEFMLEYIQNADNAEVKFDMGRYDRLTPQEIAAKVKGADVIIFVGGISAKLEGEEMRVNLEGFRGGDRTNIALPKVQTDVLKALKATGKPVVFVNMSGSAMGFEWEAANIPAIIQAWYGGQAAGDALADVLFGDYNPAGRLPVTFYRNVADLPDFEDYNMDNRTYRYFKGEVLYPFGFGLSYTSFKYDNLQVQKSVTRDGNIAVAVNVTNTGKRSGDEVVQLYLSHKNTACKVPIRALKGFQRIYLKAGETKTVRFLLTPADLAITGNDGKQIQPGGDIEISAGGGQPLSKAVTGGSSITIKL